jgi:hypothetical protein
MDYLRSLFQSLLQRLGLASKDATLVLLGLDNAGKTTLLYRLKNGAVRPFAPTQRANIEEVDVGALRCVRWGIGAEREPQKKKKKKKKLGKKNVHSSHTWQDLCKFSLVAPLMHCFLSFPPPSVPLPAIRSHNLCRCPLPIFVQFPGLLDYFFVFSRLFFFFFFFFFPSSSF